LHLLKSCQLKGFGKATLRGEAMIRKTKTLIVDDSAAVLSMMEGMLNEYGIVEITQAEDGLQAMEQFERALLSGTPYSLVFLDIVMPVLDGQATLTRMRALEKQAGIKDEDRSVIIMATSLHSTDDMIKAIIDGDCTDYLVKPFEGEDLRNVLIKYAFLKKG
jgi:two-component system, chemotaxis family, chemotaxis protein CheY